MHKKPEYIIAEIYDDGLRVLPSGPFQYPEDAANEIEELVTALWGSSDFHGYTILTLWRET